MMDQATLAAFERLNDILDTLRVECPWDRVQTLQSLRYLTIEEVYELSEALLRVDLEKHDTESANRELKKELGDIFMHLMFYSKIAHDEGRFSMADVFNAISDKLVDRHPFIYRKEEYNGESWEQIKMHEGRKSVMEGVPTSLPPLVQAVRMQEKATGINYHEDPMPHSDYRIHSDGNQLQLQISPTGESPIGQEAFGDMLFALIHWGLGQGINADDALSKANLRFKQRVQDFEKK